MRTDMRTGRRATRRTVADHRSTRFGRVVALLAVVALALVGCGGGDDTAAPDPDDTTAEEEDTSTAGDVDGAEDIGGDAEADGGGDGTQESGEVEEVTFLTVVPPESLTFTPELLATAAGYFEEEGLDVTLEPARGSPQAVQAILSELALLSRVGDFEVMQAVGERGADDLVNLGMALKDSSIRFVSSPDDPVESAEDFTKGLVGIPSEGGNSEVTIDLVGRAGGVEDDLDKQVVGLSPGTFDLVESGRLIGYAVSLDTAALLEQTRDAVVFNPGEAISAGGQVYMANRNTLQDDERREQVEGFLRAAKRAMDDVIADQKNDFENVLATMREVYDFDSLMNDDIAIASLNEYVRSWTLDGPENVMRTSEDRWQQVYDEIVDLGLIESGLDPTEWYSNDYLPE